MYLNNVQFDFDKRNHGYGLVHFKHQSFTKPLEKSETAPTSTDTDSKMEIRKAEHRPGCRTTVFLVTHWTSVNENFVWEKPRGPMALKI